MAQYLNRENFLKVLCDELGCDEQIEAAKAKGGNAVDELKLRTDLYADSLDTVALGMKLEDTFAVELTDDDLNSLDTDCTVADAYKLIERLHTSQFAPAN